MVWKNAVGIMQAVHRRFMSSDHKTQCDLPRFGDIRKTGVMPTSADQRSTKAWQVYLDNYANAFRQGFGDERTQLFFEVIRIIKNIHAEKHTLEFLLDNVASMDNENRDIISHYIGVWPIVVCASGISQVRR